MRPYELMVLIHPDTEEVKAQVDEISEVIKGLGGEFLKADIWGKRRLAYPVNKQIEGYYALLDFNLEPSKISEIDRLLKLRDRVLRHLIVRLDEE
ncbi:MAG TPA: 30S ribosomal protein S6 [Acetomicrobium flavidum]|uniref:Small ribosomal subunit protein bS6 n=1 Tax=Acetomicrobium flavidum TaxID=49896 RepID=A0ABY1JC99_9BACT|nr:30S ribosomal protein S6 [Acetomicrobium sp.]NLG94162.1 30S ribosomal protein S6 [Acetomicrobium flavidum]SIN65279.1 SSU ribosomal protein S6P [Acetomicrobium flavidum]HOJ81486.1 30S ribosomal protein S6 [Acetomicrobium flavidum]HOM30486.1 30S ribosomal protein S6 [Acetomicrobium flavidum]